VIVAAVPAKVAVLAPDCVTTVTSVPAVGSAPASKLNVAVSPETLHVASGRLPADPKGVTDVVVSAASVTETEPAGV
jgi:hypothetical protein